MPDDTSGEDDLESLSNRQANTLVELGQQGRPTVRQIREETGDKYAETRYDMATLVEKGLARDLGAVDPDDERANRAGSPPHVYDLTDRARSALEGIESERQYLTNDKRIEHLESEIQELRQEVEALRGACENMAEKLVEGDSR